MPQPQWLSGFAARLAVFRSASRSCMGHASGCFESRSAAAPATSGAEKEVPELNAYDVGPAAVAIRSATPIAMTSGLVRGGLPAVGPTELVGERRPPGSTAPT